MAFLSKFAKNVILLLGMIVVTILCVLSVPFTTKILNYSLGYDKLSVGVNTVLFGILSAIALFTGLHLVCQKIFPFNLAVSIKIFKLSVA